MDKFYDGCFGCVLGSCERCFECAETMAIREDWIHSLGFYFSRCNEEHKTSKWSQAVIKFKMQCKQVVSVFGKITACYIERHFDGMRPYLITSVPEFSEACLFHGFQSSSMQLLARSVFANLKDTKWISVEDVLIQRMQKLKKQQSCRTDRQRMRNIKGIYAVQKHESVKGRNIILLDDVVTSGATMKECATGLLEAGAREVVGITLARTFRKGDGNGNQSQS